MSRLPSLPDLKPLAWVGSALDDLRDLPEEVRSDIGYALFDAQCGGKSGLAKPLKGFGGAVVLEIVEAFDGEAYRAVYTVRLAGRICAARFPKEVEARHRDAQARHCAYPATASAG